MVLIVPFFLLSNFPCFEGINKMPMVTSAVCKELIHCSDAPSFSLPLAMKERRCQDG